MTTRIHNNPLSWAIDLLRERPRYRDWRSWLVNARNRVIIIRHGHLPGEKPIHRVNYAALSEPVYVRMGSTDLWVLDELFVTDEYRDVVTADLGPVRQIVDLGANVGISIRFWLQRWPDARIIGVEPDANNFMVANMNAQAHRGGANVRLVRACVAGSERRVSLDRSRHESMYTMVEADEGGETDSVPAYPMTRILADQQAAEEIDLLKCDIEGAEREVFADCREWIGRVRNMILEVHPPYSVEELLSDCERNGTRFEIRARHDSPPNEVVLLTRAR